MRVSVYVAYFHVDAHIIKGQKCNNGEVALEDEEVRKASHAIQQKKIMAAYIR